MSLNESFLGLKRIQELLQNVVGYHRRDMKHLRYPNGACVTPGPNVDVSGLKNLKAEQEKTFACIEKNTGLNWQLV